MDSKNYMQFLPYWLLYFFFNNLALPHGLLYTTILSPIFIYFLYKNKVLFSLLKVLILVVIAIPFQLMIGLDIKSYITSFVLLISVFIFGYAAFITVQKCQNYLAYFFNKILLINMLFIGVALIALPMPFINEWFWYYEPFSAGIPVFPRLMLAAYEPSHYGLLLSPVFMYFLIKIIKNQGKHQLLLLLCVGLSLLLSLSFGILAAMLIGLLLASICHYKNIPQSTWSILFKLLISSLLILGIIIVLWPNNPVILRIENIVFGKDTSANGRLLHSFMFALDLIKHHGIVFGIGPGQIKILAHDFIVNFYQYEGEFAKTVRIPNAMAEMIATYGLYGAAIKIGVEVYLFFKLKIYNNLYNLSMFIYLFIYQFTGSFLTNVAEIGTWIFVFGTRFQQFEIVKFKILRNE